MANDAVLHRVRRRSANYALRTTRGIVFTEHGWCRRCGQFYPGHCRNGFNWDKGLHSCRWASGPGIREQVRRTHGHR